MTDLGQIPNITVSTTAVKAGCVCTCVREKVTKRSQVVTSIVFTQKTFCGTNFFLCRVDVLSFVELWQYSLLVKLENC